MQMKEQKKTLTGKDTFEMKVPVNNLASLYDTFLFLLFWNYRNKQFTRAFCVRFLAAASLQGLVQEGTMTSLCIAMTEEQHKSMIIDCSGPQPQLHNAGEITAVIPLVSLSCWEPLTLEVVEDIQQLTDLCPESLDSVWKLEHLFTCEVADHFF